MNAADNTPLVVPKKEAPAPGQVADADQLVSTRIAAIPTPGNVPLCANGAPGGSEATLQPVDSTPCRIGGTGGIQKDEPQSDSTNSTIPPGVTGTAKAANTLSNAASIDSTNSTIPPKVSADGAALYPVDSTIGRFVAFGHAQVETPKLFLVADGLTLVSVLVNRRVYFQWGTKRIFPNLYQVTLGGSGIVRKSEGIQILRSFVDDLCPEVLVADFTSAEQFVKRFSERPIGAMIYSEGKSLIDLLNSKYGSALSGHLMRLYDCESISTDFKRDENPLASSSMIVARDPFLTMLVGIVPDAWRMQEGNQVNGLMGRFEVLYSDQRECDILCPPPVMAEERAKLLDEFRSLQSISGEVTLTPAAYDLFLNIQADNRKRLDQGPSPQVASNLCRMPFVILRIAILYQLASTHSRRVNVESVELARRYVEMCHESYLRFAGEMAKGSFTRLQDRVIEALRKAGDKDGRCRYSLLLNRVSTHGECNAKTFKDALETLADRGLITRQARAGALNPDVVLIKEASQ